MYKIGHEKYDEKQKQKCKKCGQGLVRLYRHINPQKGKQKWVSICWYCSRCKFIYMDE